MKDQQQLWTGVEQLTNDPALQKIEQEEFIHLPVAEQLAKENGGQWESNRRDFLKYLGFGIGAATIAAAVSALASSSLCRSSC